MIEFSAAEIGYIEDSGVVICGAASNADGAEKYHYINFQRPTETGSPDDEGMYFEVDDQSCGGYNIIASCELEPNKLTVKLAEPNGGTGDTVVVHFAEYSSSGLGPIDEGLRKVFLGYENLLQVCA